MKFKTNNKIVLNHPVINDCLIFDLETDSLNTDEANIKFIGAYSYKNEKYYILSGKDMHKFQDLLNDHRILIGFNNKNFDNPILENNGFAIDWKIVFDCYWVLYNPEKRKPNRKPIIKLKDGSILDSKAKTNSLRDISKALDFEVQKGDIDYKIFRKESWTKEELKEIEHYLFHDIMLTRLLFEFYIDYFDTARDFVDDENINKLNYIRSSQGSFTYSGMCHECNLPVVFADGEKSEKYEGAFVLEADICRVDDGIYFDFTSLYPLLMAQCNLWSIAREGEPYWDGDDFFTTFGKYSTNEMGVREKAVYKFYKQRKVLKENKDPRELWIKIFLNALYGISSSPIFVSMFTPTTAKDTTLLGRQCLQYAVKIFNEYGLPVRYGDTDSCFVELNGHTKQYAMRIADLIVEELQEHFPFPVPEFQLKVDDFIKSIWFFGKKKFYVYINDKNKLVIKGLPIIKGNASMLGQKILEILKPQILENQDIKFKKVYIDGLVDKYLKEDIAVIGQIYNVKPITAYKGTSSIQAQISIAYGEGSYQFIANKKIGTIGKSKKYCTPEEARTLEVKDLCLDKFWNEITPFLYTK